MRQSCFTAWNSNKIELGEFRTESAAGCGSNMVFIFCHISRVQWQNGRIKKKMLLPLRVYYKIGRRWAIMWYCLTLFRHAFNTKTLSYLLEIHWITIKNFVFHFTSMVWNWKLISFTHTHSTRDASWTRHFNSIEK